jgi:hypothetical protein
MLCPYACGITFDRIAAQISTVPMGIREGERHVTAWLLCPGCNGVVIELTVEQWSTADNPQAMPHTETRHLIWPRGGRNAAPEVPEELRSDFAEAASILDLSPQASAALSRRILQVVLVDHVAATGRNLEDQIDSVIDTLPTYVAESLHPLRHVGNFGAHRIKDTETGAVVPVEPGEAEWTLDTVETLFDHVFVAPKRAAGRRAAVNEKLERTGRPQLDDKGRPIKPATT